jgi:hypothetical protein
VVGLDQLGWRFVAAIWSLRIASAANSVEHEFGGAGTDGVAARNAELPCVAASEGRAIVKHAVNVTAAEAG